MLWFVICFKQHTEIRADFRALAGQLINTIHLTLRERGLVCLSRSTISWTFNQYLFQLYQKHFHSGDCSMEPPVDPLGMVRVSFWATMMKVEFLVVIARILYRDRQRASHNSLIEDLGWLTQPRKRTGASDVDKKLGQHILEKYFRKFLHNLAPWKMLQKVFEKVFRKLCISCNIC